MRRVGLSWRRRCATVALLTLTGALVFATGALADAGNPILGTIKASATQSTFNGKPTVTIYVRGQWNWLSHTSDCNTDRAATGAGIIWNDLNGTGTTKGNNEKQRVALSGTVANATFKLTFKNPAGVQSTSALINSSDTATTLDGKLEAMPSIGAGNVSVTDGPGASTPWNIEFTGSLGTTNVNTLAAGNKSSGLTVTITTPTPGVAPVTNGYLVANGGISAYVGSKGNDLNPADRMVHPVDRGNQVEGYSVAGTDYPATQAFVDPASNNPNDYLQWKGGCGRTPISETASKDSLANPFHADAKGTNCAGTPGNTLCGGHPWGSWGYEKNGGLGYSHTYYADQLPDRVCVNFYDVHGGGSVGTSAFQLVKGASEITVDGNGDNSIDTNAFNVFDTATQGGNCISLQTPAITTEATSGTVGDPAGIWDDANLTGVPAGAGGTITFKAYGPRSLTSTTPDCSTLAHTSVVNVSGPGHYLSKNGSGGTFTPAAGKYDWTAEYSGDAANLVLGVSSACGATGETSTVGKAQPSVTTDAGGPYVIGVNGTDLSDTATLKFAVPPINGTITFTLYDDATCTAAHAIGTSTKPITANGSVTSDPVHVTSTGTYHWIANFSGDSNNFGTSNGCGLADENPVVNPRDTSITTNAGGPYTFDPVNGNFLFDDATLAGGTSGATGTLTFTLWSDSGCTQTLGILGSNTATATVNGANSVTYTSAPGVHVIAFGTYHWKVHYDGDANNNSSDSACGALNENPQVLNPSINIDKSPDNQTIETGTTATFTITVSNGGAVGLSNVTVSDPNSPDCDRTAAQIEALIQTKYSHGFPLGTGESVAYTCHSPTQTSATAFHNVATTSGTSQGVTVSDSDDADVKIIHPQIDVTKDPKSQSVPLGGTANFTIVVTNTGDSPLTGIVLTDPLSPDCDRTAAQTAALVSAQNGGATELAPNATFTYNCSLTNVQNSFVNVITACGNDELNTNVCDNDTDGGGGLPGCPEFARCGEVTVSGITTKQNLVPNDTATLSGLVNTPNGNLRFKLYKGPGCDAASLIFDSGNIPAGNGDTSTTNADTLKQLLASAGLPTNTAGTYNWLITYSGDTHGNSDLTSSCGTENFVVTNG